MKNFFKAVALVVVCNFASADFVAAQDMSKKFGEDSITCRSNISLYREFFRQKNYAEAYIPWKAVVADCPMSTKFIFADGPVILEGLYSSETDPAVREQYLTELFDLFDLRIKLYPEDEGYTLGRIGVYSTKYRKEKGYKDAFESLDKSIDLEGKRSSPQVLDIYFQVAEVYMKNNNLPTDVIMDAYDKVSEVMELMIDESEMQLEAVMRQVYKLNEDLEAETIDNEKYLSDYEKLRTDSVQIANELTQLKNVGNNMDIRFSNHANCDMLIKTYGEKIKTSQDERTLKQIRKFFDKAKCTDNEIYEMAVEELHKIRPAANTAYFMGLIYFKKSKFTEALNYFKEAADMYEKEANIITASIMMAECYIKLGQYAAARETANKILRLNPTKGIAYILIGNAYMASVSSCNTTVPGAVYWAAADKYIKARTTDSSVTEEANRQLSTATARFPKIDDYFGLGLSKGESYSIGCWINETTTIR